MTLTQHDIAEYLSTHLQPFIDKTGFCQKIRLKRDCVLVAEKY